MIGRGNPFRRILGLLALAASLRADALIFDRTHESRVFGETRHYRIFLPSDYANATKRYPVIYWFHGFSERYNKPVSGTPHRNYDQGDDYGGDTIARFVSGHDVIVAKWDGYNPRTPGEEYPRPYNVQPVETNRQFPLYFPEFVQYIDATYRTIPDREHRAISGLSMGGFLSFWVAGKYPHLVSSASNFMGSSEFVAGPREFPVEYRHDEISGNYDGVRTRLIMGTRDFIQFYHRRMNLIWKFTRPDFETEEFDSDHGTPGMAKTFAFHMRAFANPLPRPAAWNHSDVFPDFEVWNWSVASDRKRPGFTRLANVSAAGFASAVREWLPNGRAMPDVKLKIATDRLYPPGQPLPVTITRLRDGQQTTAMRKADSEGRLTFELDGNDYEVSVGSVPALCLNGFEIENAAWAETRRPVRALVRILNKGAIASKPAPLRWEAFDRGITLETRGATIPSLAPGKSAAVPLAFTVLNDDREMAKLFAIAGGVRLPLEIPVFPIAEKIDYEVADGKSFPVFQKATEKATLSLGAGNGDGRANPGERVAILVRDGDAWRAAELFSNDRCLDLTTRVSDTWGAYDHVGASVKYSLPLIRGDCPAGHVIRILARLQLPAKPNHTIRYGAVELPVR